MITQDVTVAFYAYSQLHPQDYLQGKCEKEFKGEGVARPILA